MSKTKYNHPTGKGTPNLTEPNTYTTYAPLRPIFSVISEVKHEYLYARRITEMERLKNETVFIEGQITMDVDTFLDLLNKGCIEDGTIVTFTVGGEDNAK